MKEKIISDAAKTLNNLEETVRTEEKQGTDETLSDLLLIPRDNILPRKMCVAAFMHERGVHLSAGGVMS